MSIECQGCGNCASENVDSLPCSRCGYFSHTKCISVVKDVWLKGDVFYNFICSKCSESGSDELFRKRIPWLTAVLLSLYNLHHGDEESNQGYYHWRMDICKFIADHWIDLFGPKCRKKKTWQGVVSSNLTSNVDCLFSSGTENLNQQGWWKLKSLESPALQLTKAKSTVMIKKESTLSTAVNITDSGTEVQPILLKRVARPSGNCMLNAIALKEKRDNLLVDPNEKLKSGKPKVDKKRQARDEIIKVPSKRRQEANLRPVSDFENFWETLKIGKKHVTVPKDGAVLDELRLRGKVSRRGVELRKHALPDYNCTDFAKNVLDIQSSKTINLRDQVMRTYQKPKKPKPPSTVTSLLTIAKKDSTNIGTKPDCISAMDGELNIDLSHTVSNLTSQPDFTQSFEMPEERLAPEATLNTAVRPMSPEASLEEPLSPEEPVNPLVFLPQFELSHLDLGREVELGENFTSLDTEIADNENFPLSDVEEEPLQVKEPDGGEQVQSVNEDIPNFHSVDRELYGDESTALEKKCIFYTSLFCSNP